MPHTAISPPIRIPAAGCHPRSRQHSAAPSLLPSFPPLLLAALLLCALTLAAAGPAVQDARVFQDKKAGSWTITFSRAAGEPEVRFPVAMLGLPENWSSYRGLNFDFLTTSLEPFRISFSDGEVIKGMVIEPYPAMRIRAAVPFESFVQTRTLNPLLPLGYKAWPERLFTFQTVKEVIFRMRYPGEDTQITLTNFRLTTEPAMDDILDRRPVLDAYGQWIAGDWPGKVRSDAELRARWDADTLPPANFPFCELGGMKARTLKATGFFRVEKVSGRWMFIDPHGHPFFSTGMDLVGWRQGSFATRVTGREFLFEQLPQPGDAWLSPNRDVSFHVVNAMKRHGEGWQAKWEKQIIARLRAWGFNTVANWSDRELAVASGMPYVLPLGGWTTAKTFPFPWNFPDVFSEEFVRNVDEAARKQVAHLKDDPRVLGWFIGNEPYWAREFGSLTPWADMLLADPEPSATKAELQRLLAAAPANAQRIKDDWVYTCARKYFEVIVAALRKHDPNHLVLGIRYAGRPKDEWVKMCSIFDVFSINIYSRDFAPDAKDVSHFAALSGKPVVIGEFTAAAPGRGLQGLFYWGHKVKDLAERGPAYRYYVEQSAAHPDIIGTHWFQLVDDLPTGRPSDLERLNYGFLDVLDLPYPDLVNGARETHRRLYDLMFGKAKPYGVKPRYQ